MTLRRGSRGAEVTAWQSFLRSVGHAVAVDGVFGSGTEQATIAWQRSRGLEPDGVVGPASQAAALAQPSSSGAGTAVPGKVVPVKKTVALVKGVERLTVEQLQQLDAAASEIGVPLDWLAAVISFETGGTFSPRVLNAAGSRAVGLIQFMPATARTLLRTATEDEATRQAAAMTFAEQLQKMVVPYFKPYAGRLRTLDDLYLAVLYPAFISRAPDDVVARREGPNAAVYRQNSGFDRTGKGFITKLDITERIRSVLSAARGAARSFDSVAARSAGSAALPLFLLALGGGALVWLSRRAGVAWH